MTGNDVAKTHVPLTWLLTFLTTIVLALAGAWAVNISRVQDRMLAEQAVQSQDIILLKEQYNQVQKTLARIETKLDNVVQWQTDFKSESNRRIR